MRLSYSQCTYSTLATDTIPCLAGDSIILKAYTTLTGAAVTLGSGVFSVFMAIERVGN